MNLTEPSDLRVIGEQLAALLQNANGRLCTTPGRQALVLDLCAEREDLAIPLKDTVSRRSFDALVGHARSRNGVPQRDALLDELGRIYSAETVGLLAEFLNGFLGIDASPTKPSGTEQTTCLAFSESSVDFSNTGRTGSSQTDIPDKPGAWRISRYLIIGMGIAVLSASGLAILRLPVACVLTRSCDEISIAKKIENALKAAEGAAEDLMVADDFESFNEALDTLDGQLELLADQSLTSDDEDKASRLRLRAARSKQKLGEEMQYQQLLRSAETSLDDAERSDGINQIQHIRSAQRDLEAIPKDSFVSAEASQLRSRLNSMIDRPFTEIQPSSPQPPPIPRSQPQPEQQSPAQSRPGSAAPSPARTAPAPPARPAAPPPQKRPAGTSTQQTPAAAPRAPKVPPRQESGIQQQDRVPQGASQYSLPKAWEQRREQRRESMNN